MKTDLEVMNEMVKENLNIKATTNLIGMEMIKQGGKITFGVDRETYLGITNGRVTGSGGYYVIAYVIEKEQFDNKKKSARLTEEKR